MDAITHLQSVTIVIRRCVAETREVHTNISCVSNDEEKEMMPKKIKSLLSIYLYIYISLYSMCFRRAVHAAAT